jgi:prepilin-type processing-associated H-X9-DG protein
MALLQYEQDFDEGHPSWDETIGGNNIHWQDLIYAYVKSLNVFNCPSNPSQTQLPWFAFAGVPSGQSQLIYVHYGANINSVGGHWWSAYSGNGANNAGCGPFAAQGYPPFNISQFTNPTTTIDLAEVNDDPNQGGTQTDQVDFEVDGADFATNLFAGHTSMTNYLFTDGHVKALRPTQTLQPVNLWTIDNTATCTVYGGNFNTSNANTTINNAQRKYQ